MTPAEARALAERAKERERNRMLFRGVCRDAFEVLLFQSDLPQLIDTKDAAEIGQRFLRSLDMAKQPPVEFDREMPAPRVSVSDDEEERRYFDRRCR